MQQTSSSDLVGKGRISGQNLDTAARRRKIVDGDGDKSTARCMFQLSLMLARIALEPVSEIYKDDMAQALLGLIRSKPKSSVVQMFSATRFGNGEGSRIRAIA